MNWHRLIKDIAALIVGAIIVAMIMLAAIEETIW